MGGRGGGRRKGRGGGWEGRVIGRGRVEERVMGMGRGRVMGRGKSVGEVERGEGDGVGEERGRMMGRRRRECRKGRGRRG